MGHPAAECPDKPAPKCFNCKQEGHPASECKSNRVFDNDEVPDLDPDEAWEKLVKADSERDLDDFREVLIHCTVLDLFANRIQGNQDLQQSLS